MTLTNISMTQARIDWQPLWEDYGIPLAIMGLVVVFAALTLLRIFIGLMPRFLNLLDHYFPEAVEEGHGALLAQPVAEEIPDEIVAVITAAVAATVVQPHRIVHTRDATGEGLGWSLEGRRQHHSSHQIRTRNPN